MKRKTPKTNFTPFKSQALGNVFVNPMNFNNPQRIFRTTGGKRPVDKLLINVLQDVSTTQLSTVLTTATFSCTVVGLRWQFGTRNQSTSDVSSFWAIILVKDGETINTMATSDGSTLFNPEQNVLVWGNASYLSQTTTTGPAGFNFQGDTKTMRKLMGGDRLVFIAISTAASVLYTGTVQFFCKT